METFDGPFEINPFLSVGKSPETIVKEWDEIKKREEQWLPEKMGELRINEPDLFWFLGSMSQNTIKNPPPGITNSEEAASIYMMTGIFVYDQLKSLPIYSNLKVKEEHVLHYYEARKKSLESSTDEVDSMAIVDNLNLFSPDLNEGIRQIAIKDSEEMTGLYLDGLTDVWSILLLAYLKREKK